MRTITPESRPFATVRYSCKQSVHYAGHPGSLGGGQSCLHGFVENPGVSTRRRPFPFPDSGASVKRDVQWVEYRTNSGSKPVATFANAVRKGIPSAAAASDAPRTCPSSSGGASARNNGRFGNVALVCRKNHGSCRLPDFSEKPWNGCAGSTHNRRNRTRRENCRSLRKLNCNLMPPMDSRSTLPHNTAIKPMPIPAIPAGSLPLPKA